ERLRVPPDTVAITHLPVGVEEDREREPHALDERGDDPATLLVLADREEREVVVAEGGPEPLHRRHHLDARRTPRRPEVQHDDLSAERREPHGAAVETRHGEVGRELRSAARGEPQAASDRQPDRRGREREPQAAAARHVLRATRDQPPTAISARLTSCASVRPRTTGGLMRTNSTRKRAALASTRYSEKIVPSGNGSRRSRQSSAKIAPYAAA